MSFDMFDAPKAPESAAVSVVQRITVEELLDPDNPTPRAMKSHVAAAKRSVLEGISRLDQQRDNDATAVSEEIDAVRRLPDGDPARKHIEQLINGFLMDWNRNQPAALEQGQLRWVRARVLDDLLGAGAIEPLRRDKRVTEILVRAPEPTLVVGAGGQGYAQGTVVELQGVGLRNAPGVIFESNDDIIELMRKLHPDSARVTTSHPMQSAALADGSRIEVAHPIVTDGNTFVAFRRHPESAYTLQDLIDWGTVSEELACDLASMARNRLNIVLSGSTSSGKTSTTNALIGFYPTDVHLAVVEDTKEIKEPKHLRLVTRRVGRPSERDGVDNVTIRTHVRAALRSRPDVILIGEVRGPEAVDALDAMNTGHEGSMTTCHANSAHETVIRLETMMSQSGEVTEGAATHKIASAVDVIIFQTRAAGRRRVAAVYEVVKPPLDSTRRVDFVELRPLWQYDEETGTHDKVGDISAATLAVRNIMNWEQVTPDEIRQVAGFTQPVTDSHLGRTGTGLVSGGDV